MGSKGLNCTTKLCMRLSFYSILSRFSYTANLPYSNVSPSVELSVSTIYKQNKHPTCRRVLSCAMFACGWDHNLRVFLGCVHTWCSNTSTQAQAQNGAVFRHWVPHISLPSSVPECKVSTLHSGMATMPKFWCGYLKKRCVHISAHQELFSGTMLGHQV